MGNKREEFDFLGVLLVHTNEPDPDEPELGVSRTLYFVWERKDNPSSSPRLLSRAAKLYDRTWIDTRELHYMPNIPSTVSGIKGMLGVRKPVSPILEEAGNLTLDELEESHRFYGTDDPRDCNFLHWIVSF